MLGVQSFVHNTSYINTTMPAKIVIGCRVSAKIGPFQEMSAPEGLRRQRRERSIFHGTVIESRPDLHWRVHWDECDRTSDHLSRHLSFMSNPGRDDLDETLLQMWRDREDVHYIGKHSDMIKFTKSNYELRPIDVTQRSTPVTATVTTVLPPGPDASVVTVPAASDVTVPAASDVTVPAATDVTVPPAVDDVTVPAADDVTVLPGNDAPDVVDYVELGPEEIADPVDADEIAVDDLEIEDEMRSNEECNNHSVRQANYLEEKRRLIEDTHQVLVKGPGRTQTSWKVIDDILERDVEPLIEFYPKLGVRGFDFSASNRTTNTSKVMGKDGSLKDRCLKNDRVNLLNLFLHMWGDDDDDVNELGKMNQWREKIEQTRRQSRGNGCKPIAPFTRREHWVAWGLVISSRCIAAENGEEMWNLKDLEEVSLDNLRPKFDPNMFMTRKRFQEWKKCVVFGFADEEKKEDDPWWQIVGVFDSQTRNRKRTLAISIVKVLDESMSAFRPQVHKTGNVPHLSFVKRKPEPLGTELKIVMCTCLMIFIGMFLCRKKGDDGGSNEYEEVTTMKTARVSLTLMGQAMIDRSAETGNDVNRSASPEVFLGDAWFSSVELVVLTKKIHNSNYIGVVKTNSSKYPKNFLADVMSDWPGGSHLNLEATVDGVQLVATGYKYCNKKVLFFIWTRGAGHTEPGKPFVAKWTDTNQNRCERWIDRPSVISFYFEKSNGIDVSNQMRQKELRLEKCWVTNDGYFRILTSMIGMNVVDCWRAYRFHCRDNHRHKQIQLIPFVNMLAHDMLFNNLPTQESLNDSFSIAPCTTLHEPPHQATGQHQQHRSTTGESNQNRSNSSIPGTASLERARNEVASEMMKHVLIETTLKEKAKTSSGWRHKRAVCTMEGCNRKTRHYCAACIPPLHRDKTWVCKVCSIKHTEMVRETFIA